MSKNYSYGRTKEEAVGKFLISKGWKVWISLGSSGAYDLFAIKGSRKWFIQVKATRKISITSTRLSPEQERRLKISATKGGGVPVLALVAQNTVAFYSVRNYIELNPR